MEVSFEQFSKAEPPIDVTLSGTFTLVREEQLLKAFEPILVRVLGKTTFSSLLAWCKAWFGRAVTPSLTVTVLTPALKKIYSPVEVRFFGKLMEVNAWHFSKAELPIDVTLSGILTLVRE